MRKLFWLVLLMVGLSGGAFAQTYQKIQGYCEKGGETVTTDGRTSTTKVQRSYPSCTITVYDTGTTNLASIASNSSGTPKSNPFTADSDGYWSWFALAGEYDVKMSGGGLASPITRSGYWIVDGGGGGSGITGSGTTDRFPIFTGSSSIGNSVFKQVGTSEFTPAATGKRINLGTGSQQVVEIANASVGGTTQNRIAKLSGAPSTALTATVTDTTKLVGIVIAGAGTTGNAQIVTNGNVACDFDGATTAGDYVGASTTSAGKCTDLGSTLPTTGVQVLGRVLTTLASAGSATVYVFTGEQGRGGTAGSGTTNYLPYWVDANTLGATNALYSIASQLFQFGYSVDIANGGLSELTLETDQIIFKGGVSRANNSIMQTMKATASQTGDFQRFTTSGGSIRYRVDIDGDVLARGVNYTWPSSLPVSTGCLQISTSGVMSVVSCVSGTGVRYALNIKQSPYSCVGDGVTDDTTCFQTALDDAAAAGGYMVYAPAGTYKVTGLTVEGGVTLEGDGKDKTIIYSVTNATILDLVQGTGTYAFLGPKVRNLWVKGSDTGASQIGINVDDATYVRDVEISSVRVDDAGSYGIYFGKVFSSSFQNIYSNSNQGYNFFYNSPNMPSNYFFGLYSGDISATSPAGYRIKQGTFSCWSCNGINAIAGSSGYWAVIGGKNGDIDGDTTAYYATVNFTDCNIEGAKTSGVLVYPGSVPSFRGLTTFVGLTASSGSYVAIDYDTDASLTPENYRRGYIEDTVVFSNSPASFYSNSQPIQSDGVPPVSVNGRGPQIAGGGASGLVNTYYNTATSRAERINRVDGYAPSVSITASTSFANPGPRAFRVNCGAPCTLTLPSPNFYENGNEIITVYNLSSTGTNVTIAANGGAAVNGSTYVISIQGDSVQLYPDFTSLDWKVVGNRIGAGSTDFYALFDSAHSITQSGSKLSNSGGNLLVAGGIVFSTDNSINIGASSSNRPAQIYVGTAVTSPSFYNVGGGPCYRSGSGSPEGVETCEPGSIYLRTNGSWYLKASGSGNTGWSLVNTSGTATLTSTYVGYGNGSNVLTGTSDYTYSTSTKTLSVINGSGASTLVLNGSSDTSSVKFGAASVPGNQGGIFFPFVGGGQSTGPGVWWGSSASYASLSGLWVSFGLNWQGANSSHDPFMIREGTGTSSNGTIRYQWSPSSSLYEETLSTAATGTAFNTHKVTLTSTGTAGANFGAYDLYVLENGSGSNVNAVQLSKTWTTATAGAETGKFTVATNLAGLGVGDAFTVDGGQYYGTLWNKGNISGSVTLDFINGNTVTATLTGNVTSLAFSNLRTGGVYFIHFIQDALGPWTLTVPAALKVNGGYTISAGINKRDLLICSATSTTQLYCSKAQDQQ